MRKRLGVGLVLLILGVVFWTWAGNLEPDAPPASTMVTLEEIDAKLSTLATGQTLLRFVGVTASNPLGNDGWLNFNDRCEQEFGAAFSGVRMCFSEEIMRTPVASWPSIPSEAWVQPTLILLNETHAYDISGVRSTADEALSCGGWRVGTGVGLALDTSGSYSTVTCGNRRAVTCCAE